MALQGTLETFSVPEVLRLLAGTNKTGLLSLEGDRGVGKVWLAEGRISTARSEHEQGDRIDAVLFDLLRFSSGSFVFEPGARPDDDGVLDVDVEDVLTEAERLLQEWREIEAVVPSLDVRVQLVDELSDDSVTVTADQWRSLALIGGGITARRLGANLHLGEFDACDLVRGLVEAGLVDVTEDMTEDVAVQPAAAVNDDDDRLVDHDLSHDEVASLGQNLAGFVAGTADAEPADQIGDDDADAADADAADEAPGAHELTDTAASPEGTEAPLPVDEVVDVSASTTESFEDDIEPTLEADDDIEPEDFLSQLSNLSPKAAAAIEAAAEATEPEDAEVDVPQSDEAAPLTAVADVDGDEEINRNLLLKFLSSAKN